MAVVAHQVAHEVGADESFDHVPAAELVAAGVGILMVYPTGAGKAITRAQWDTYLAAGIALGLVDEHGNQQMVNGGNGFGTAIARENIAAAKALGLTPADARPLYYVAEDPTQVPRSDWPVIVARFREICAAHLAAGWVLPGDLVGGSLVGAYGGGPLLEYLYLLAVGRWLWPVSTWGPCPHAVLYQDPNTTLSRLGGAIDRDYLAPGVTDCGQYPAPNGDDMSAADVAAITAYMDAQTAKLLAALTPVEIIFWASVVNVPAGATFPVGTPAAFASNLDSYRWISDPQELADITGVTAPEAGKRIFQHNPPGTPGWLPVADFEAFGDPDEVAAALLGLPSP